MTAETAVLPGELTSPEGDDIESSSDEEPSLWPDGSVEAPRQSSPPEPGDEAVDLPPDSSGKPKEEVQAPLPALESLVNRIPTPVRETMDDLFRAKFVAVKRIPEKALKR